MLKFIDDNKKDEKWKEIKDDYPKIMFSPVNFIRKQMKICITSICFWGIFLNNKLQFFLSVEIYKIYSKCYPKFIEVPFSAKMINMQNNVNQQFISSQ